MVWKNFKKKNNKNILKTNVVSKNFFLNNLEYRLFLKENLLKKKSGIIHGINSVTGDKVKDAFVTTQLKNLYKPKILRKSVRFKNRKGMAYILKNVINLEDNNKLMTNNIENDLVYSKRFINLKKNKFTPPLFNRKWISMHLGTFVDTKQVSYLQSKDNIRYKAYDKKITDFNNKAKKIEDLNTLLGTFNDVLIFAEGEQDRGDYNKFIRYFNYKNLLFRSFWFNKFVSTLVKCGKKYRVWNYILRGFSFLKTEFGRNPIIMLFEILEMYRMPIRGLAPKSTTRKSVVRTHMVPWWKQYTQILRWIRHAIAGSVKNFTSWNTRIRVELLNLMTENNSSLVKKRIEANFQLIAFGRISIHFRWHRRYNKRAVKAIKISDKKLYNS